MYLINGTLSASLPFRLHLPDGQTRTSLHEMSEVQLAELGIYPVDEIKPVLTWTQRYGTPVIEVADGRATATYPVLDYSEDEVAGILDAAKAAKRAEIAAARWAEMSSPTTIEGYTSLWYADKESVNDMLREAENLRRAINLGYYTNETVIKWKTADGTFTNATLNDLETIQLLLSQKRQELYEKEANLVELINIAETPEQIASYVWNEEETIIE